MHDFPEASSHSPRREPTTTPLQQLFLLNSPWVRQRAAELQQRLAPLNETERIQTAWQLLFARLPDADETQSALDFIHSLTAAGNPEAGVWQDYLQVLFSLNELHFTE